MFETKTVLYFRSNFENKYSIQKNLKPQSTEDVEIKVMMTYMYTTCYIYTCTCLKYANINLINIPKYYSYTPANHLLGRCKMDRP